MLGHELAPPTRCVSVEVTDAAQDHLVLAVGHLVPWCAERPGNKARGKRRLLRAGQALRLFLAVHGTRVCVRVFVCFRALYIRPYIKVVGLERLHKEGLIFLGQLKKLLIDARVNYDRVCDLFRVDSICNKVRPTIWEYNSLTPSVF